MPQLVNLGSLCVDHVYQVPNLAGAGETVASRAHDVFPGGKGLNQSLAAARAGARVRHVGCVGEDGELLLEVLAEAGVDVAGIRQVPGEPSGHAVIQVNADGENAIVIAGGANRRVEPEDVDLALAGLAEGDWLLLQNEINDLETILQRVAATPARVAFNVAPVDGREQGYDLANVDLLIVNDIEAAALVPGIATGPDSGNRPLAALEELSRRFPHMAIVLTLGAAGLLYVEPGSEPASMEAFEVRVADETAAGDAFIGYCLAGLLSGSALPQALVHGSAAGALAVTRAGAASSIPGPDAVAALVRENPAP